MFKRSSEINIGSIFPISSLLIRIPLILIALEKKMRRQKSFGHSRKACLGLLHSEKMEFLKTDTLDKAYICNKKFETAFTRECDT